MATAALILALSAWGCAVPDRPEPVWVTIPAGATLPAVAESLETAGVVRSATSFRWYVSWRGKTQSLKPGVYDLRPDLHLAQVADALIRGVAPLDSIVIPAGITLVEAAPLFQRQLGIPQDRLLSVLEDRELVRRAGARGVTIEGYLFPGKYYVREGMTPEKIVSEMVDRFEQAWPPEWTSRLDTLGMNRDEIVTLASIVEAEARYDQDRLLISSVYHNRLASGLRLQADPTVNYALGERRRLFNKDYDVDSPYNTYLIDGLPPAPIGQPSKASLVAALYPAESDYLYFVAGPDGWHHFSRTYTEHLETIRELRP
jgi:peptidoglycan lytic transglycosylase G